MMYLMVNISAVYITIFCLQDFNKESMNKCGHGNYMQLDTSLLPPLHLIYAENPSDSGKVSSSIQFLFIHPSMSFVHL